MHALRKRRQHPQHGAAQHTHRGAHVVGAVNHAQAAQSKVGQLDVAGGANEHVVRLQGR